jgi:hypothetical protein
LCDSSGTRILFERLARSPLATSPCKLLGLLPVRHLNYVRPIREDSVYQPRVRIIVTTAPGCPMFDAALSRRPWGYYAADLTLLAPEQGILSTGRTATVAEGPAMPCSPAPKTVILSEGRTATVVEGPAMPLLRPRLFASLGRHPYLGTVRPKAPKLIGCVHRRMCGDSSVPRKAHACVP